MVCYQTTNTALRLSALPTPAYVQHQFRHEATDIAGTRQTTSLRTSTSDCLQTLACANQRVFITGTLGAKPICADVSGRIARAGYSLNDQALGRCPLAVYNRLNFTRETPPSVRELVLKPVVRVVCFRNPPITSASLLSRLRGMTRHYRFRLMLLKGDPRIISDFNQRPCGGSYMPNRPRRD